MELNLKVENLIYYGIVLSLRRKLKILSRYNKMK